VQFYYEYHLTYTAQLWLPDWPKRVALLYIYKSVLCLTKRSSFLYENFKTPEHALTKFGVKSVQYLLYGFNFY
jgi:hypothetical protein